MGKGRISWSKGLTKETHPSLKKTSEKHLNKNNINWKGDKVGYHSLHEWITTHKKKSEKCEECKQEKKLELANISGEYKRDINDYRWLCRKCHMIYDNRLNLRNKKGQFMKVIQSER